MPPGHSYPVPPGTSAGLLPVFFAFQAVQQNQDHPEPGLLSPALLSLRVEAQNTLESQLRDRRGQALGRAGQQRAGQQWHSCVLHAGTTALLLPRRPARPVPCSCVLSELP